GRPIGDFQLTQYKLGRMATHLMAARQLTYAAARAMDADESVSLEPAMAKLFASDVAVWVTQEGQLLHGGWGYAEEFAISRHVVDALVLPAAAPQSTGATWTVTGASGMAAMDRPAAGWRAHADGTVLKFSAA